MIDFEPDYRNTLDDFHRARRRAAFDEIVARITGKASRLLQYDEVRKQLQGLESANRILKDIPLDSIVGTVGRYNDFNRKLLPINEKNGYRWARVKIAVKAQQGLPPIDVYQVGDAYFILDGHHRASIARQMGATHIQAYVREVFTKVPLSPEDDPEDLLLKSEYTDFLNKSRADLIIPGANLLVSALGSYAKLLEHISVHRYYMGIENKRDISLEEAVVHWYENVYLPVVQIIRQRNILKDFPGRTEADLYLWIMDHRADLEDETGLRISPSKAAGDLISRFSPTLYNFALRVASRIFDVLTPDPLEIQPPSGVWRRSKGESSPDGIFENILVAVSGDESGWTAVEFAARVARNENANLAGLHMIGKTAGGVQSNIEAVRERFMQVAPEKSSFIVEQGDVTKNIYSRSFWCDLLVLRLAYPPPIQFFRRFGSGMRTLIRLVRVPILTVPPHVDTCYDHILLAYGGGRKADEALFMAAYLAKRWNSQLTIITVRRKNCDEHLLRLHAEEYLTSRNVHNAHFIEVHEYRSPSEMILHASADQKCNLILMGGYEGGYLRELVFGSTVDKVLQKTKSAVMICH